MKHDSRAIRPRATDAISDIVDSATLIRLIEEVRVEGNDVGIARNYDRTHNRHNR